MSSLTHEHKTRKGWRLRVYTAAGRKSIWLGELRESDAIATQRHVDEILAAQTAGIPLPRATGAWLKSIPVELRSKLRSITGAAKTLADAIDEYLDDRNSKLEASTLATLSNSLDRLSDALGDTILANVTEADTTAVHGSLTVAKSTLGKYAKHWRQFFSWAIDRHYIAENPAASLSTAVSVRQKHFVAPEVARSILQAVECDELRAAILLSRWGGIRIPSELYTFQLSDIDRKTDRITIHDTKRDRTRQIPIFPELREIADRQSDPFPTFRDLAPSTIAERFRQSIIAAGLTPWPALWHSMRATRETELIEQFGLKAACEWIGNSEAVALKSYNLIPDSVWSKATESHL